MSCRLCASCSVESQRWLDYRLPRVVAIAYGSGAPYDISPAGIRDRRRSRFELWRDTIRFNRQLIADRCRKAGHAASTPTVVAARFVEVPLFDLGRTA